MGWVGDGEGDVLPEWFRKFCESSLWGAVKTVFFGGVSSCCKSLLRRPVYGTEGGVSTLDNVCKGGGTRPGLCSFKTRLDISPSNEFVSGFGNLTR